MGGKITVQSEYGVGTKFQFDVKLNKTCMYVHDELELVFNWKPILALRHPVKYINNININESLDERRSILSSSRTINAYEGSEYEFHHSEIGVGIT